MIVLALIRLATLLSPFDTMIQGHVHKNLYDAGHARRTDVQDSRRKIALCHVVVCFPLILTILGVVNHGKGRPSHPCKHYI